MPSRQLNRVLWVTVVVLIAFFALRSQDVIDLAMSGIGKLDVRDDPANGTLYLRWRGKIEAPMAQRIAEAIDKNAGSASTVVLSLSSPGGALDHGAEVIGLLRRIGERQRLETVVESRSVCASMCVPVYLQGEVRQAAASARFMFHEVSFRESLSEDEVSVPDRAIGRATDRFFAKYFAPAGVAPEWIAKVRQDMAGGRDIWKTARELAGENAGIVQKVD